MGVPDCRYIDGRRDCVVRGFQAVLACCIHVCTTLPCFVEQVIELDYSEADQDSTGEEAANTEKQLVYYQLDLGLNHVTRLWSDPISR